MFVDVKWKRSGKIEKMAKRYADVLVKVGQAVYYSEETAPIEEATEMPKKPANKALTAKKPKKKKGKAKAKKTEYQTRHLTAGDI